MDWLDIVTFLSVSKNLKSKDVINFCNTNQKIKNLCNKYSDTIWSDKLYNDFKITKDQIIGNPKSYYIGLENNIFQYYFYNFETEGNKIIDLEVVQISEEDSKYDDHFTIPGTDKINNVELVVGILKAGSRNYGFETNTVYSKSLEDTLGKLANLVEEYFPSDDYTDIRDKIEKMEINTVLNDHLDITGEFISGIYFPVDVKISVFRASL